MSKSARRQIISFCGLPYRTIRVKVVTILIFFVVLAGGASRVEAQCDSCVVDSTGYLPLESDAAPSVCEAEMYDCSVWRDCIRFEVGGGSSPRPEFYFFIPNSIFAHNEQLHMTFWLIDVLTNTEVSLQDTSSTREMMSWDTRVTHKHDQPWFFERWTTRQVKERVGSEEQMYKLKIMMTTQQKKYLFYTSEFQLDFR
jgi:hypothetical protein